MDMEKSRQQLIGRLTENYADYRAELLLKDRQELIDGADRIAKTAEVFPGAAGYGLRPQWCISWTMNAIPELTS